MIIYELDSNAQKVQLPWPEVDSTIMSCQLIQSVLAKWYFNLGYHIIRIGNSPTARVNSPQHINLARYSVSLKPNLLLHFTQVFQQ